MRLEVVLVACRLVVVRLGVATLVGVVFLVTRVCDRRTVDDRVTLVLRTVRLTLLLTVEDREGAFCTFVVLAGVVFAFGVDCTAFCTDRC